MDVIFMKITNTANYFKKQEEMRRRYLESLRHRRKKSISKNKNDIDKEMAKIYKILSESKFKTAVTQKELLNRYFELMQEKERQRYKKTYKYPDKKIERVDIDIEVDIENEVSWKTKIPSKIGDYTIFSFCTVDGALADSRRKREHGYWSKIVNHEDKVKDDPKHCVVYISNWTKDKESEFGTPKWQ